MMKEKNKAQVFNVIILDKSGSMEAIREAAVDGFNETLVGIKKAQEKYADTQDHFISLITFCDCEKKYVFDKIPVSNASSLSMNDYVPCCCTPLYDAIGFTLNTMHKYVKIIEDSIVVVTIITDGMENSSKEYTGPAVRKLVEQLKGEGWTFTYMGANQDAIDVAGSLAIRNGRNYESSVMGAKTGMVKDLNTRMNFFSRLADFKIGEFCMIDDSDSHIDARDRHNYYTEMANEAFDEEERLTDS